MMKRKTRIRRREFVATMASAVLPAAQAAPVFKSNWAGPGMLWPGPEYWANPLQDWRVEGGRLECIVAGGDRNVFLLTREVGGAAGTLRMSVRLGRMEQDTGVLKEGFAGFRVGIHGHFKDYRDSAVRGVGLNAGVTADGRLFIESAQPGAPRVAPLADVRLRFQAIPSGAGYTLTLEAQDTTGKTLAEVKREQAPAEWLAGGLALVCSSGVFENGRGQLEPLQPSGGAKRGTQRGGTLRFWFKDWTVEGTKVMAQEDRAFGPILWAMHTLSRGVLKLTAQMAPVPEAGPNAQLQVREGGRWRTVASSAVDTMARTATFRIGKWNAERETPYRVTYPFSGKTHLFHGLIRREPVSRRKLTIAALTCNNDLGFPHSDVARNVAYFKPDLLLFTGDQIYERVGEYGNQLEPLEPAMLDYLRKWYLFGWAYRDLLRDTPSVALPDDHDVYHGNVWGAAGRKAEAPARDVPANQRTKQWQDSGGYKLPAAWVNAVQRTQTSHLPDPFDPAPVDQGIGVYYTSMLYGGLSLAFLEDRKWKSAPRSSIPWADIQNGWAQNPAYDAARHGDIKEANLLGPRQIEFLEKWARDWSGGAFLKIVVSQTVFANVATLPKPANNDDVTPGLAVNAPGVYPEGEVMVMDHDSNGWPRTGRDSALRAMRKAVALHIGGDQHLGSTIQYGIDTFNDGPYCLCTPAISNIWPRRWYPPQPGQNRKQGSPYYCGEFTEAFGNKITVHAVSNPMKFGVEPAALHERATGYGIVEVDRVSREITLANWPRFVDPAAQGAKPYAGWPVRIHQFDNGLTGAAWRLETLQLAEADTIVQVIEESSRQIQYTVRSQGRQFIPKVFSAGAYTVKLLREDGAVIQTIAGQRAVPV
ncbi:MAG: alkaline phosphatase D family protein [Acidobacteriia bacterium]|nr:alkaline phosphatase D family protein [Terriglobia bacterium]